VILFLANGANLILALICYKRSTHDFVTWLLIAH